ncbi:sigma-54-dependent transcriptional regulator [Alcaligenes faecalis]|uniref:sigma-54-dependent transcriptional regulator n=1 Tax=Alcaligenes faecalis TaxID=511 RepID=UPI000F0BC2DA|nr:sigma-54 dependent transcriptional regulator [Alcaligenes faecalis]AYR19346.1 sigma-54-dependent Fis family transcriptional regulator [Alcaligenes faecalis]
MYDALTVLIVEDDANVRLGCSQTLLLEGIRVEQAESAEQALRLLHHGWPGIVVSDVRLPGADGMSLLQQLQHVDSDLPVVLITGHGDVSMAVQAMKMGAYDFIEKPFSPEHFVQVVSRALDRRQMSFEIKTLQCRLQDKQSIEARVLGNSSVMSKVRELICNLGNSAADVLIFGETGTGKELVARCLHEVGHTSEGNFVAVNCGALSDSLFDSQMFGHEAGAFTGAGKRVIGKIEHAHQGTLFLDEIESMPMAMQVKLLRVLQERTLERLGSNQSIAINCRVIAATKVDLLAQADQGQFRHDLYYRLNMATLPLPPLRERREDIGLLFEHFALLAAARHGRPALEPDSDRLQAMLAWHWPGNVRELRNFADRCVLGVNSALPGQQAAPATVPTSLVQTVEAVERALIVEALRRHQHNLTRAGQELGIAKSTLHDKIRKYGLSTS